MLQIKNTNNPERIKVSTKSNFEHNSNFISKVVIYKFSLILINIFYLVLYGDENILKLRYKANLVSKSYLTTSFKNCFLFIYLNFGK